MRRVTDEDRRSFILEHTRLDTVPLVPEIAIRRTDAVSRLWFEVARWLDDDDVDVPFWCVPWAGGQALARYVLDHPDLVRGKRVLDFACGDGIVAIAAARAGATVRAADVDPFARIMTELNRADNHVEVAVETNDLVGDGLPDVDVVLAGDVWYEPEASAQFRRWFRTLSIPVITADAGRKHAPRRARELARYEVPTPFELEARLTRTTRVLALDRQRAKHL